MRPRVVSIAIGLLYAALGVGMIRLLTDGHFLALLRTIGEMPILLILVVGLPVLMVGLYWKVGQGCNWARVTLLVFCIFFTPFGIFDLLRRWAENPLSATLGLLQVAMSTISVALVFTPSANSWFRAVRTFLSGTQQDGGRSVERGPGQAYKFWFIEIMVTASIIGILSAVTGVSSGVSMLVSTVIAVMLLPHVCMYLAQAIILLLPVFGIILHLVTTVIGFREGLLWGIGSLLFPGFSELYWSYDISKAHGTALNPYVLCVAAYAFLVVYKYTSLWTVSLMAFDARRSYEQNPPPRPHAHSGRSEIIPTGSDAVATRSSGLVKCGLELIKDGQPKKPKVLVTDDSSLYLETMKTILEGFGYEVVILESKIEALEKLGEIKPDLVTTDLNSPRMSGLEFIQLVKELDPSIPVIMISGNFNAENAREAIRLGAFDCVRKPFDVAELRQVVDRALETCRLDGHCDEAKAGQQAIEGKA